MELLDKQWIFHGNLQQCEQFEKTPNTLGLKNMAGVFILVGAGIIGGIGLIIIEVVYKKHQIKKQKRLEIARHAADKWRGTVEVRKLMICSLGAGVSRWIFLREKGWKVDDLLKAKFRCFSSLPKTFARLHLKSKISYLLPSFNPFFHENLRNSHARKIVLSPENSLNCENWLFVETETSATVARNAETV